MEPGEIEQLFRREGGVLFARWGRPIVPVVFGVDDKTLGIIKGAIEAVVALAGHKMAETDPELGSNLMFFFFRDWGELLELDGLERMVPELATTVSKLEAQGANQYRVFRFDAQGAIKAAFVFLRMDDELSGMPAEELALAQAVQVILLWGDRAFAQRSPLARLAEGKVVLRPDIAAVITAGYDPVMPAMCEDGTVLGLRMSARVQA